MDTDFIIVGAGSAGCVVANRLSAAGYSVTLLEAGGTDRRFWVQVPIGYGKTFFDQRVNWCYNTQPEAALNGRTSYWPRGKVLGGSSSINAMVYVRGHTRDFDDWAKRAGSPWSAAELLPWFERFEQHDVELLDSKHADPSQKSNDARGPLTVTNPRKQLHPLIENWLQAGQQAGFALSTDFNRDRFEGVGHYHITTRNGVRCSTARAYLRPALRSGNLRLIKNALVTRIVFNGRKATGVEFIESGQRQSLSARREVIVCGGSINSPQLLQLSGVGAGALLQQHSIDVVADSPAVGQNLQDHLAVNYYYRCNIPTLNDQLHPLPGKIQAGIRYALTRSGVLALSVNQGGGFVRSRADLRWPDQQLYFTPASYTLAREGTRPLINPDPFSAYLLSFQPCRPSSRGHLQIRSPDPQEAPDIVPNYLSTEQDIEDVIAGCHLLRQLAATPALKSITIEETEPGPAVQTDEALLEDFRERSGTVFHPVSTCIMGTSAADSVVDPSLNVYGVDSLRIIDASVFPNITSGNTNAPTIMLAERAAALVIADHQSH